MFVDVESIGLLREVVIPHSPPSLRILVVFIPEKSG